MTDSDKIQTLPLPFLERMKEMLGDDYDAFLKSYKNPRTYGLRVNTAKLSCQDFQALSPFPIRPIPWINTGYFYEEESRPARCPYYQAGLYYLQEPSAMTPASRLPIEPGDFVLDLCAAPGGKATALGAALNDTGFLLANDISTSRARALLRNLELFGMKNMLVTDEKPAKLAQRFPAFFNKILLDAPCSGEGMFRKEEALARDWTPEKSAELSDIQKDLVLKAADMLRPGGMLLYSTCTFSPEENEQTIEYLLQEYPEFKICEMEGYEGFADGMPQVTESKNPELEKTVRIFPHRMKGEGHFLALLQKGEKQEEGKRLPESGKNKKLPEELEEFLGHIDRKFDSSRMDLRGEKVYYMPEGLPTLRGIRFLRTGLLMGELKKNRFEPSQALAMNLKKEEYDQVIDLPLEDERVMKYLKGETLDVEDLVKPKDKGWYLICVDGYPLGFGKLVNQMIKNKYLPGWRWNS